MPVHDWNRVTAGTFHAFHLARIAEIQRALNGGLLPPGYYALAEQVAGEIIPDVLTLQRAESAPETAELKEEFGRGAGALVLTVTNLSKSQKYVPCRSTGILLRADPARGPSA